MARKASADCEPLGPRGHRHAARRRPTDHGQDRGVPAPRSTGRII